MSRLALRASVVKNTAGHYYVRENRELGEIAYSQLQHDAAVAAALTQALHELEATSGSAITAASIRLRAERIMAEWGL